MALEGDAQHPSSKDVPGIPARMGRRYLWTPDTELRGVGRCCEAAGEGTDQAGAEGVWRVPGDPLLTRGALGCEELGDGAAQTRSPWFPVTLEP